MRANDAGETIYQILKMNSLSRKGASSPGAFQMTYITVLGSSEVTERKRKKREKLHCACGVNR
jgi:hypothetical protein